MEFLITGLITAFRPGILTSISPCPLATNIVALSYLAKEIDNSRQAFLKAILYTLGRLISYILLTVIIVISLLILSQLSEIVQVYLNMMPGPLLIVVGFYLIDII